MIAGHLCARNGIGGDGLVLLEPSRGRAAA